MTSLQSVWWNLIISRPLLIYLIPRYDSNKKKKKNHQQRDKLCCAGTKAPSHINTQSLPLVSCLCSCFSFISLLKGTQEGWGREEEETSCSCTLRYSLPRSSVLLVVFVSDNDSDDGGDDASDNWGGSCGVKGNLKKVGYEEEDHRNDAAGTASSICCWQHDSTVTNDRSSGRYDRVLWTYGKDDLLSLRGRVALVPGQLDHVPEELRRQGDKRSRKWGRRGSILHRLRRRHDRPAVPSICTLPKE